jgi:hypothetical protein
MLAIDSRSEREREESEREETQFSECYIYISREKESHDTMYIHVQCAVRIKASTRLYVSARGVDMR